MTKFSEMLLRADDARRVAAIRDAEAGRVNRQFGPLRARLTANAAAMAAPVAFGDFRRVAAW